MSTRTYHGRRFPAQGLRKVWVTEPDGTERWLRPDPALLAFDGYDWGPAADPSSLHALVAAIQADAERGTLADFVEARVVAVGLRAMLRGQGDAWSLRLPVVAADLAVA